MKNFTTLPYAPSEYVTAPDLASRCAAASRMAMRGASYSPEDRAECAAAILARVLADSPVRQRHDLDAPLGAPCADAADVRTMLRRMDRWLARPSELHFLQCAPDNLVRDASFTRLSGLAANFRRALDSQRQRDAVEAAERAATDAFTPILATDRPALPLTREAAAAAARDALGTLGLARVGKCFPLAYYNARMAGVLALTGDDREVAAAAAEVIAAELGYASRNALDASMSRARKRVPSVPMGMAAHLDAADLLDAGGVALKPTASRNATADLEADWRTRPTADGAVTVRMDPAQKRDMRRKHERPAWTRDLPAATAARLERTAEIRRARVRSTDAPTRDALAYERGDAPTVR